MTTATAELCGHRWVDLSPILVRHRCERPALHRHRPGLVAYARCRCRCGATTTRKDRS